MQRIFRFYISFKEYFIFTILVIVSIVLIAQNDNLQLRSIRSLAIGTIGSAQASLSFIPNIFALEKENRLLRELNISLADEVNLLRESRLENFRLRKMIALHDTSSLRLIPAKVIGKNLTLLRNTITLSAGENDGVQTGMPIVTGEGLAGRVIGTSGRFAIVQILLNIDFRASAKIQRSRVDGILSWDGTTILLKNVPKSLDVRPGDAVITSEYSNSFPPNIKIGIVSVSDEIPNSLFKNIQVIPSVDFGRLEEAFILDYTPSLEKIVLETKNLR